MFLQVILNLLKKMLKYLYVIILLIFLIFLVLLMRVEKKDIKIGVIENAINLFDEGITNLDISFYINQKKSYITDINKIKSSYLENKKTNEIIKIEVTEFILLYEANINKESFYKYLVNFKIDLQYDFYFDDCLLVIDYENKIVNLKIGSVSGMVNDEVINNDVTVSYLKGLVIEKNNKSYLGGIYIGLKSDETIKITNISLSDYNVIITDAQKINDFNDIENYENLIKLNETNKLFNDVYISGEEKFLLFLGYHKLEQIPEVGLKIDYTLNNEPKTMFYPKFRFYINHNDKDYLSDLVFYELSND